MKYFPALLLTLVLAISGCGSDAPSKGGGPAAGADKAEKPLDTTLRLNLGMEPTTIDPSLMTDIAANLTLSALMEGLVRLDKDCKPLPAGAESWVHNSDSTVWTFHLRPGAKWHNGDPVVAGDYVYAMERILTPSTNSQYAEIVCGFLADGPKFYADGGRDKGLKLESVRAIDEHTLEFQLSNPTPFFPTVVTWGSWLPVNAKAVAAGGDKWTFSEKTFVGNGPFRMTALKAKDRIETAKWDEYWDKDSIFWDKIVFLMIDDDNTEDNAFKTGEIDITESVAVPKVAYWKDKPEFRAYPVLSSFYISFNTTRPPFNNVLVRKAFSKAIDRKLIVEKILRRGEFASEGFIPRGMPSPKGGDYREQSHDLIGPPDAEGARALLKEAGITDPASLGPVEFLYNTREENKIIAEQMQAMWKSTLGVDVRIQNAEWGVVIGRLVSGDFQFARSNWVADYIDPMTFLEIFQISNSKNSARLSNPKYDELIEAARREPDPVRREQYFIEAERMLVEEECVIAPLYSGISSYLAQTDIEGLESNAVAQKLFLKARRVRR